jgi:hypothetical protein
MSHKNPTVSEILKSTTGIIGGHLHKSYLDLAKARFYKLNQRRPTLDDAQALRDTYEEMWMDYYIERPKRFQLEKILAEPIWTYGCSLHVDVKKSMITFLRDIPGFTFDGNVKESNYGTYIVQNNLFEDWKEFVYKRRYSLRYVRQTYVDFSALAYNGVTEDM